MLLLPMVILLLTNTSAAMIDLNGGLSEEAALAAVMAMSLSTTDPAQQSGFERFTPYDSDSEDNELSEEDCQAQKDELLALESIFGSKFERLFDTKYRITLTAHVEDERFDGRRVNFDFSYPKSYPSKKQPEYTISAPWMPHGMAYYFPGVPLDLAEKGLTEIYAASCGSVVIYEWVNWIEEVWIPQAVAHMPPAKASSSTSTTKSNTPERSAPSSRASSPVLLGDVQSADVEPREASQADKPATRLLSANKGPCEGKRRNQKLNPVTVPCPPIRAIPADRHIITNKGKGRFIAHCARVRSVEEVNAVMAKLRTNDKIAEATHNMFAYRIAPRDGMPLLEEIDDDGEGGSGNKIMFILHQMNATDMLVVVTRWYGGSHIYGDRFRYIGQLTREVLEADMRNDPTYPFLPTGEESDLMMPLPEDTRHHRRLKSDKK